MEVVDEFEVGGLRVVVAKGDITRCSVDAIVNPANSLGVMGGGVAAAIKEAGGEIIEEEAMEKAPIPVGQAVETTAGDLDAEYVIHAPTMERPAQRTTVDKVRKATEAALRKADELGVGSVAFPGMGTGVGGVPYEEAAEAMVDVIERLAPELENVGTVYLVGYDEELAEAFRSALKRRSS
ncbi:MAG: macro domain-containing protein [Methanopyri archaeon]|nr:macro domain-containing protein [Methanopyri archaeon]